MNPSLAARAKAALADYVYELDTGDAGIGRAAPKPRGRGAGVPTWPAPKTMHLDRDLSGASASAKSAAVRWESDMLPVWRAQGRLTEGNRLRTAPEAPPRYTLADVARVMPHLNAFDCVAALADLDGVVGRDFLSGKEHQNIRDVMEKVADERLTRRLQAGDAVQQIQEIVRATIAEVFAELKAQVATPVGTTNTGKGRASRCSKCRQPGHRATTCRNGDAPTEKAPEDAS